MQRADSLENTLMLGKIEGRRRGQQRMRWLDVITDSTDRVWASSRGWWRTGKPGMLQSMGSRRAGHNFAVEQQQWFYPLQYLLSPCIYKALNLKTIDATATVTGISSRTWEKVLVGSSSKATAGLEPSWFSEESWAWTTSPGLLGDCVDQPRWIRGLHGFLAASPWSTDEDCVYTWRCTQWSHPSPLDACINLHRPTGRSGLNLFSTCTAQVICSL